VGHLDYCTLVLLASVSLQVPYWIFGVLGRLDMAGAREENWRMQRREVI
jgi:hypothetical protein